MLLKNGIHLEAMLNFHNKRNRLLDKLGKANSKLNQTQLLKSRQATLASRSNRHREGMGQEKDDLFGGNFKNFYFKK